MSMNPLFEPSTLPYQLPPFAEIREEHYAPALERAMAEHLEEIAAIAADPAAPTFSNTIVALELAGQLLRRVWMLFQNQTNSDTTAGLQALQAEFNPRMAGHWDAIRLDGALFARIRAVYEEWGREESAGAAGGAGAADGAGDGAGPAAGRLVERYYADFVRAGALLGDADKARLREMNAELARLGTQFEQNLFEDTRARAVVVSSEDELAGLSPDAIRAAAANAAAYGYSGQYLLSLQLPSNQALLASLARRSVRERLYLASVERGVDSNPSVVLRIARLRAERAALLGYPNHAAYEVADQTAKSVPAVESLLRQLVAPAMANAAREREALRAAFAADGHPVESFAPWDWQYYAEKVRKRDYEVDAADLRPYFELERVLWDGVFYAAGKVYGLRFEERTDLVGYHKDVRVFEVFEEGGDAVGLFVGDYYARESKRGGAWMNYLVPQSHLLGTKPVAVNNLNLTKPADGEPTLLTFDEVRTLFHEFGHALHGLLSDIYAPRLQGMLVPRDFVEYPSQVNEMWMVWPEVLANYARHYQTGEPIPEPLVQRMEAARRFGQGFKTVEYLGATLLDWAWHKIPVTAVADLGRGDGDGDGDGNGDEGGADGVLAFEAAALQEAGIAFAEIPPRYRTTYFAHAWQFGYAAGYYSYIWSEVLDADTVEWFRENGGMTRANGDTFRRELLARGYSVDPMEAFRAFRGRDPEIRPLLARRGLG
jgi:peptidyl-dipeptidase Dcp